MSLARFLAIPVALAVPSLACAQPMPQPLQTMPQPTPDADALADAIRTLGANPRNLTSLITAGELSLKLGDPTAAAALFKRADEIDPMNGRVKAGMARILVQQERPGEALRYFDQAAGYGLDPRTFAGDRGLAYDLIGEQERAQRDYRLALEAGVQDEVQRRYALSLGISGKREAALTEIDALLRRSDRGAWRARAFILAMSGDVPGAGVIATRMMPPGMAAGLQPFFEKLPSMSPVDRAFAVHFGETRPTPLRLADARMAPPLPALTPDPRAAPILASAETRPPEVKRDRRRERELARDAARERRRPAAAKVAVASAAPAPAPASALPQPPGYAGKGVAFAPPRAVVQTVPRTSGPAVVTPTPVRLARNGAALPSIATGRAGAPPANAAVRPATSTAVPANIAAATVATSLPAAAIVPPVSAAPATPGASEPAMRAASPSPSPGFSTPIESVSVAKAPAAVTSAATTVAGVVKPETPIVTVPRATAAAAPLPAAPATVTASAFPVPSTMSPPPSSGPLAAVASATPNAATPLRLSEDDILARIIAGISVPASELGVAPIAPAPAPAAVTAAPPAPGTSVATPASVASAEAARRAADAHRQRTAAAVKVPAPADPAPLPVGRRIPGSRAGRQAALDPVARRETRAGERGSKTAAVAVEDAKPIDSKAAARKALADKKAAADKKLAAAKKVADAKQAAEEKKAAKADPPRIWVQVAGGANESDLPKAWAGVRGKAAALAGRPAYSTPLRATNRVVTGPFKTDAEARAFVNSLAKQGVSAFPFTSEKGQKMTKLPPK